MSMASRVRLNRVLWRSLEETDLVRFHLRGVTDISDLFRSTTVRIYVDWAYSFCRNIYSLGVLLDVVAALTFTSFAALYRRQHYDAMSFHRGIAITLIIVPCLASLSGVFCSFSALR